MAVSPATSKGLALKPDVSITVLSQLNRELQREQWKPRVSGLRDSGAIEQDADLVVCYITEFG
jgi:replicative DNA helicase